MDNAAHGYRLGPVRPPQERTAGPQHRQPPTGDPGILRRKADIIAQDQDDVESHLIDFLGNRPPKRAIEDETWIEVSRAPKAVRQYYERRGHNPTANWATDRDKDFKSSTHVDFKPGSLISRRDTQPWADPRMRDSCTKVEGLLGPVYDWFHPYVLVDWYNGSGRAFPCNGYTIKELRALREDTAEGLAIILARLEPLPDGVPVTITVWRSDGYRNPAEKKWTVANLNTLVGIQHRDQMDALPGHFLEDARREINDLLKRHDQKLLEQREQALAKDFPKCAPKPKKSNIKHYLPLLSTYCTAVLASSQRPVVTPDFPQGSKVQSLLDDHYVYERYDRAVAESLDQTAKYDLRSAAVIAKERSCTFCEMPDKCVASCPTRKMSQHEREYYKKNGGTPDYAKRAAREQPMDKPQWRKDLEAQKAASAVDQDASTRDAVTQTASRVTKKADTRSVVAHAASAVNKDADTRGIDTKAASAFDKLHTQHPRPNDDEEGADHHPDLENDMLDDFGFEI